MRKDANTCALVGEDRRRRLCSYLILFMANLEQQRPEKPVPGPLQSSVQCLPTSVHLLLRQIALLRQVSA